MRYVKMAIAFGLLVVVTAGFSPTGAQKPETVRDSANVITIEKQTFERLMVLQLKLAAAVQKAEQQQAAEAAAKQEASHTIQVVATSYCLVGSTADGASAGRGIIAVDPSVIPLGSKVKVDGYGEAVAADTGGAIKGDRIDVWLPCGEAYAWGVRTVNLTVLS